MALMYARAAAVLKGGEKLRPSRPVDRAVNATAMLHALARCSGLTSASPFCLGTSDAKAGSG